MNIFFDTDDSIFLAGEVDLLRIFFTFPIFFDDFPATTTTTPEVLKGEQSEIGVTDRLVVALESLVMWFPFKTNFFFVIGMLKGKVKVVT